MKIRFNIFLIRYFMTISISLFAAVLSIWSLTLQKEVRQISIKLNSDQEKEHDTERDNHHIIIQEYQASSNHIQLDIDLLSTLPERFPEDILPFRPAYHILLPIQERLFKTLFRHIISPNAP